MRDRVRAAAQADFDANRDGQSASNKLKLLNELLSLMNRDNMRPHLVDPDINFLQSVRFYLEPVEDGTLPTFAIQRDILAALAKLPIDLDALGPSELGKLMIFYTRSRRVEDTVKHQAERLVAQWMKPILARRQPATVDRFVGRLALVCTEYTR